jgi:hypothetical protein
MLSTFKHLQVECGTTVACPESWAGQLDSIAPASTATYCFASSVQLAVAESTNEDLEAKLAQYKNVEAEVSELRDENELLVAVNREQKEKLEILQVSISAWQKPDTGRIIAAETYRRL